MVQLSRSLQRRKSLYEQTYQALRDSVLAGELLPGDRLVETQLAEQLQVSRTPIREAIRQLQREKLVAADANGWLRVITVSAAEAEQLYDCRMALEILAVTAACEQARPAQVKKLQQLVEKAKKLSQETLTVYHGQRLLEVDYQFHSLIAASSNNDCLISLLDQVFGKMALLRMQTTRHNPRVLEICQEHQVICDAIAHQNPAAAQTAIQSHLSASKARVVQELTLIQSA